MQFFIKRLLTAIAGLSCTALTLYAAEQKKAVIESTSTIDWTKNTFTSAVSLNTEKAGITLPSGKRSAINHIDTSLPTLIKDPLLSLYVNSDTSLGDMVLAETMTLEQITKELDDDAQYEMFALVDRIEPILTGFLTVAIGISLLSIMIPLIGILTGIG